MKTKKKKVGNSVIILILIGIGLAIAVTFMTAVKPNVPFFEQSIGGQRDEHGCLGPAGYSYNEDLGICARQWELTGETQIEAARTAAEYLINSVNEDPYGLTLIEVRTLQDCDKCFEVDFSRIDSTLVTIKMNNWEITN